MGADIATVERTLNSVRTNGQAVIAAAVAIKQGRDSQHQAEGLPNLFRGSASGTAMAKNVGNAVREVETAAQALNAPSLAGAAVGQSWQALRKKITRVYVEMAAVDGADPSAGAVVALGDRVGELASGIANYGEKLAAAGAGAPGMLVGDIAHAIGSNVSKAVAGAGAGVTEVGGSFADTVSNLLSKMFSGLIPALVVIGILLLLGVWGATKVGKARKAVLA